MRMGWLAVFSNKRGVPLSKPPAGTNWGLVGDQGGTAPRLDDKGMAGGPSSGAYAKSADAGRCSGSRCPHPDDAVDAVDAPHDMHMVDCDNAFWAASVAAAPAASMSACNTLLAQRTS
mmetsp:Transcript_65522/g.172288  ORF Transcript_65522/g.172288 Transcript_65522/m.172288 type:complete len:118 (-) Transcript_65522:1489-1842(-)